MANKFFAKLEEAIEKEEPGEVGDYFCVACKTEGEYRIIGLEIDAKGDVYIEGDIECLKCGERHHFIVDAEFNIK